MKMRHLLAKLRGKRCGGIVHGITSPSKAVEIEICDGCEVWKITAHGRAWAAGRTTGALGDAIPGVLAELREAGHVLAARELDGLSPAFEAHRNA